MGEIFHKFATSISEIVGTPWAFLAALLLVVLWVVTGPVFQYSDSWQLVINTSTTIITFLMVFIIQSSQNRDTKAIHIKLDELLRAVHGARTGLVNIEHLSDEDLLQLQQEFERLGNGGSESKKKTPRKTAPKKPAPKAEQ
ncbi:MAG TPA: low affinity iron permease family protein [Methylophilaceae bacterium]|nr:low affinity iron permease family protein [Methylophilaceae bacterium]